MNNLLNLKSFIKFLSRNKVYTAIDIFGLSVSLMFVILISIYTIQELSTDKYHENADNIYILGNEEGCGSAFRLAYRIQERYPEVEKVCPVATGFNHMPVFLGETKMNADLLFADSTFFSFFSFPLINGDRKRALDIRSNAIISETFAHKIFGNKEPLGESIRVNDSLVVTVSGVMKDIKNSVLPYCDILLRIDNVKYFNNTIDSETFDNAGSANIFILTNNGPALQAKATDMAAWFKKIYWIYEMGNLEKVTFIPLKDLYFSGISSYTLKQGDWKFVMILMSVGFLILIFAVINYINLTVAQTGFRAKEMATRRLLGSSRGELFARLVLESTILSFVSFLVGLLLASGFAPYASSLLETKIYLSEAITPFSIFIVLILIVILGLISGLLPAIIISNAKPIEVVRGSFRTKTKMIFSKFFITFQNCITIALIAASITMVAQIYHLKNAPLGYNTTNILNVSTFRFDNRSQMTTFVNELKQLACVNRVALSAGTPFDSGNNYTTEYEGKSISFQILQGDTTFFNMLGFVKLRENNLGTDDGCYLSEQAMRETGLSEDATSFLLGNNTCPIDGIIKDFQMGNVTNNLRPVLMRIKKTEDINPWNILIEVKGDPFVAYTKIKEVYEPIVRIDFDGRYIDQQIDESFSAQKRMAKIVVIFAVIAILISLLGLLAMSTYFIQQQSMEIAVRKVFGSTNREILFKLVRTFLNYVFVAFVIATPVVWHLMRRWLSDYSYRIELSPFIFIAAGLFCFLVSFITVFVQSYEAANSNPVDSVKSK